MRRFFMPEFLTEKNYLHDFQMTSEWIFGVDNNTGQKEQFEELMSDILLNAYLSNNIYEVNKITFMTTREAEAVKYFRNCFLATKVGFCNEFASFCRDQKLNYNTISKVAANDHRIGHSHINVPGYDGKFGFGGTCFPKDLNSMIYQININKNKQSIIMDAVWKRNVLVDRPEQDWTLNKGRCVAN